MKNIYKNLSNGQFNILLGSYRDLFYKKPVGSMLIQEATLPSSKEVKKI